MRFFDYDLPFYFVVLMLGLGNLGVMAAYVGGILETRRRQRAAERLYRERVARALFDAGLGG